MGRIDVDAYNVIANRERLKGFNSKSKNKEMQIERKETNVFGYAY